MSTLVYGHHKVKDYNQWRPFFDSDEQRRLSFGIKIKSLAASLQDSNDIHFVFELEDMEQFNACFQAPELAQLMEAAGVLERPDFVLLKEI
jgi:hypothetical protein